MPSETTPHSALPRFRFNHQWGRLPADLQWGAIHGLAFDRAGHLYVAHTVGPNSGRQDAIVVFDARGYYLRSFGSAHAGEAHGLEILEEGGTEYLYLTDLKQGLFKMTLEGEQVWHFDKPALYKRLFGLNWVPSNVAAAPDGDLYLADGYGTGFIIRIDRDGREVDYFGGPGKREDCTPHPHGLIVDTRPQEPLLLIAENLPASLHYLTLDGEHVRRDYAGDELLRAPRHFLIDGERLIMPDLGGRVTVFDRDNAPVGFIGDGGSSLEELFPVREDDPATFPEGVFIHPHDVALDTDGNLYVAEWVKYGRLSRLTPE